MASILRDAGIDLRPLVSTRGNKFIGFSALEQTMNCSETNVTPKRLLDVDLGVRSAYEALHMLARTNYLA